MPLQSGDRILTGRSEYGSAVLAYLQLAQRKGVEVVVVPNDDSGQIDVASLADLIDERTKLIGLTWVPTAGGLVNLAADVGRIDAGGADLPAGVGPADHGEIDPVDHRRDLAPAHGGGGSRLLLAGHGAMVAQRPAARAR